MYWFDFDVYNIRVSFFNMMLKDDRVFLLGSGIWDLATRQQKEIGHVAQLDRAQVS